MLHNLAHFHLAGLYILLQLLMERSHNIYHVNP
jgi:hypothetical protein